MKNVRKGVLYILLCVLAIGGLGYIALAGLGAQHKGSTKNIRLGLDLAGGVSVTYQAVKDKPSSQQMDDTVSKIQKRVENLGEEPVVYKEGSNRINVDIPGAKDADAVLEKLGKAGSILFVEEQNLRPFLEDPDANEIVGQSLAKNQQKLYDAGVVIVDGTDIEKADGVAGSNKTGTATEYYVSLEFNSEGAKKFAKGTKKAAGSNIAIVYDGVVTSNPRVKEEITGGRAQIDGQANMEEAEELATTIRIGALPLELKEIRSNVVGAKLGEEAIRTSLIAGVIGFILIVLFMIAMYRIPGLAASIALVIYVGALSLTLNAFDVTLTLPGVAGILLSVGMAVDANVIIFQRIREELASGSSLETSMKNGFGKALSAILDGNITTLIAAVVLMMMGSGTVASFAQTLMIGVILSMITALYVTKFVLRGLILLGFQDEKFYGKTKETKVISFVNNFPKAAIIVVVFLVVCVGSLIANKSSMGTILNYGLDFKGGTSTTVTFGKEYVAGDIKNDVSAAVGEMFSQTPEISEVKNENTLTVKTTVLDKEQRAKLSKYFVDTYKIDETTIESETISASVSNEMKKDAVVSIIIAVVLMLIYIAIRFKDIWFGTSAIIALIHDVMIVLTVYAVGSLLGLISVGNTFIACMLTILGYSINATIVTFDRIRENKNQMKKGTSLEEVVNASVSQTITRNINTSLTTFIMIFMLFLLGVSSLREFTVPLMAGILGGAFSSICLTGPLWCVIKNKVSNNKAKL